MKRLTKTATHHDVEEESELDSIRARILSKVSSMVTTRGGYYARGASVELGGDVEENENGIEINDRRGDWMMIHDDVSKKTVYYNFKTKELKNHRPSGWVKMLAMRFSGSHLPE